MANLMTQSDFDDSLRLGVSFGLLNEVSCNLRGITAVWDDKTIHLKFYYDLEVFERDIDSVETVLSEMRHYFPEPWIVTGEAVQLNAPEKMPILKTWVFRRREDKV